MGRAGCVRDRRTLLEGSPPFIQRPRRTTAEQTRPAENQCARVCAAVIAPTEIGASGDASPRPRARARARAPSSPSRCPRPSSRPSPPIPGTSAGRAAGAPCWRRGASASLRPLGRAPLRPPGGVPAADAAPRERRSTHYESNSSVLSANMRSSPFTVLRFSRWHLSDASDVTKLMNSDTHSWTVSCAHAAGTPGPRSGAAGGAGGVAGGAARRRRRGGDGGAAAAEGERDLRRGRGDVVVRRHGSAAENAVKTSAGSAGLGGEGGPAAAAERSGAERSGVRPPAG